MPRKMGFRASEETKNKQSLARKNYLKTHPIWCEGKKLSQTTKEKMSSAHKFIHLGEKNSQWRGGKQITKRGYIYMLKREHPFCNQDGYVFEHRLVVEKIIGRILQPQEVVHHINKINSDNSPVNLIAFSDNASHITFESGKAVGVGSIVFDGREYGNNKIKH